MGESFEAASAAEVLSHIKRCECELATLRSLLGRRQAECRHEWADDTPPYDCVVGMAGFRAAPLLPRLEFSRRCRLCGRREEATAVRVLISPSW